MRVAIYSAIAILLVIILVYCVFGRKGLGGASQNTNTGTLEEKFAVLEDCGLKLVEPFTVNDLLSSWSREEYEKDFDLVLVGLGTTEEQEPWRNHCINLWYFDTECIEDHGDYKKIAERMVEMTQGSLSLKNIKDYVDVEEGKAWVSFEFKGQETRIDCDVQDDWVDPSIFPRFVKLLDQSDTSKMFIYYDLGAQDCIIGCVTKEQYSRLRSKGFRFEPLT